MLLLFGYRNTSQNFAPKLPNGAKCLVYVVKYNNLFSVMNTWHRVVLLMYIFPQIC